MPRKYVYKGLLGRWNAEDMAAAIKDVKENGTPLATAAKKFSVPRNTLRSRILSGISTNRQLGKGATTDKAMEDQLVNHLVLLDSKGFGLTVTDLRELAFRFTQRNSVKNKFNKQKAVVGYDWVYSFRDRHPNLSIRKAQGRSYARSKGLNKEEVKKFFTLLGTVYDQLNLWEEPGRVFNADETGVQLIFKAGKIISEKGKKNVFHSTTAEKGSTVTVMVCANAVGYAIPPFVIMKGVRQRDTYSKGMPNGSVVKMSESGYMTTEVFSLFLDHLNCYKPQGRILLIIDGHSTHCKDPDVLDKASALGIEMLCLPPHSTHRCQPLDVSYFKSFKHFYNEATRNFVRAHPGKGITKDNFGDLLKLVWDKSATSGNFTGGFRKCGIYPYNPDIPQDDMFEYDLVPDENGSNQVHVGDDIIVENNVNSPTLSQEHEASPLSCSVQELSPVLIFRLPSGKGRGRRPQESAMVTSQDYRDNLRKRKCENEQNPANRKTTTRARRVGNGAANSSSSLNCSENYCAVCDGYFYDDNRNEAWVQCSGECGKWFHEMCVENGNDEQFTCTHCVQ